MAGLDAGISPLPHRGRGWPMRSGGRGRGRRGIRKKQDRPLTPALSPGGERGFPITSAAMGNLVSNGFLALPTIFIVLSLVAALVALVWRRAGVALALGWSLSLYVAATPAVSSYL